MAFVNAPSIVTYTATAGQTVFQFGFKWFNTTDIIVYQIPEGEPGGDDKILDPSLYTITAVGANIGGSITLNVGAAVNDTLVIQRLLPVKRTTEYAQRGDLRSSTLNDDQDYQSYLLQDFDSLKDLYFSVPPGSNIDPRFPPPVPDGYIKYNAAATALEADTTLPEAVIRSEAAATAAEASEVAAAGSATAADTSAVNAEASYQAALLVEQDVVDQGNTQVARVITEGDTQELRVTTEGTIQIGLAEEQAWNAEAEALTADSIANAPVDVVTTIFTSNGDGTFTETPSTFFSAFHWSEKAKFVASGLNYIDTWDASGGTFPPNGTATGDFYIVSVSGNISGTDYFVGDWLVWDNDTLSYNGVHWSFGWSAIADVTVDGNVPTIGDNLASVGAVDSANAIQDTAIALKADTTYVDSQNSTQDTAIALKADTTYVDSENAIQDTAIALNTAKVTGADRVLQSEYDTAIALKADKTEVLGIAQTMQDVVSSRAVATDYTNSTSKPIVVYIAIFQDITATDTFMVDGLVVAKLWVLASGGTSISVIVPAGSVYRLNSSTVNGSSMTWVEYR